MHFAQDHPWTSQEASTPLIIQVALTVFDQLEKIINFDKVLLWQRALYQGEAYKSYFLVAGKESVPLHGSACPHTTLAVRQIPGLINAFYSILWRGTSLPPHRGPYAGLMR
jgi:beta-hydroxylase